MGYIGLNIAMGVVNLPNIQDYWTREPILQIPWFSTVMSQRKFLTLTHYLHFANNTNSLPCTDPSFDKLWKIRQVIEVIKQRCKEIYSPGKCVSVDESTIATRGMLSFLQYLPKKPTNWGIKLWVCAESKTGYIYNFEVYTGQGDRCEHGLAYRLVMCMVNDLLESGRIVYVDNFYTSPQLFEDLYHQGMYACGTCRTNCKQFPGYLLDEKVEKRGDAAFLYHKAHTAGKWRDKRDVHFMFTLLRGDMESITTHLQQGCSETIDKPKIICDYNTSVDIADQLMVYYACGRRTLNAHIMFRQVCKPNLRQWTQKKFRMELAYTLVTPLIANRVGQGRTSPNTTLTRLKGKHFAYIHEKRKRCQVCGYKKHAMATNKRKDTKTVRSVMFIYVMENVLKSIIHCLNIEF